MAGHHINRCKHGTVMGQCRCPGPKQTRIVACPPHHANWADDVRVGVVPAADVPTTDQQPPSTVLNVDVDLTAREDERRQIVAFLRSKVSMLGPTAPMGALSLVKAALLDAAQWIEDGDYRETRRDDAV